MRAGVKAFLVLSFAYLAPPLPAADENVLRQECTALAERLGLVGGDVDLYVRACVEVLAETAAEGQGSEGETADRPLAAVQAPVSGEVR